MNYKSTSTIQANKLRVGSCIIHVGKIWRVKEISSIKYQIHYDRTAINAEDIVLTLLGTGETHTKLLRVAAEYQFDLYSSKQNASQQYLQVA